MYIEVAAHRGNVADYPENTMSAYKSAYEIGADMIELDLRMTRDGEIVLIHDSDLARTADVAGIIRNLSLDEVLRADVGIKKEKNSPTQEFRPCANFASLSQVQITKCSLTSSSRTASETAKNSQSCARTKSLRQLTATAYGSEAS